MLESDFDPHFYDEFGDCILYYHWILKTQRNPQESHGFVDPALEMAPELQAGKQNSFSKSTSDAL